MLKDDYFMRQIEMITAGLAMAFLNKERLVHEATDPYRNEDANKLNKRLLDLLADGKINEAENLLFEAVGNDDFVDCDYLHVALDFYLKLDQYDDEYLKRYGFSKAEASEGWTAITKLF